MTLALPIMDAGPVRPVFAQGPRSLEAVKLLRLSVTDRCNLRCVYCMPEEGTPFHDRGDLLSADEILAVAAAARRAGVTHLKVTGGEPTVRGDLIRIIKGLAALRPVDLSMTTNGLLLEKLAPALARAGLNRLTVSWDSMDPDRLGRIARGAGRDGAAMLRSLRAGLDAAAEAGFKHIKINTVVMGGVNEDEAAAFARLTLERPWTVRFIEYMPLAQATLADEGDRRIVDNAKVKRDIEKELGPLAPVDRAGEPGVGPAEVYQLAGARGRVGFISAMSQPFCQTCNRLRLTAMGELRACLFDGGQVSVLPALRPTVREDQIMAMMAQCVAMKPEVHSHHGDRAMSQLGG